MDIEIDYKIGVGGSATVVKKGMEFNFELEEFDENQYADIGLKITGDYHCAIDDIYNRNSLPDLSDVGDNLTLEEYNNIFNNLQLDILNSIESELKSMCE